MGDERPTVRRNTVKFYEVLAIEKAAPSNTIILPVTFESLRRYLYCSCNLLRLKISHA